jgi:hypothetical protein
MASLHVIGNLHGASFISAPGAHAAFCEWRLAGGDAWSVLRGEPAGRTQTAVACGEHEAGGQPGAGLSCQWEHPLDVHFRSASLCGWPLLELTLWKQDDAQVHSALAHELASGHSRARVRSPRRHPVATLSAAP